MKLIFMGTGKFGAMILEKLAKSQYAPISVITAPDKPVGRKQILTPSPVKVISQKYSLPIFQPEKLPEITDHLSLVKPDLILVAAYGQILSKEILAIPKYGCLNLHPSLLPRWRGPSPIQYTILNGDKETGVTIILMDEKIDHGPILMNSKFKIKNSKLTYRRLENQLANLGANLFLETIPKWIRGKIKPKPQDESKATYTKILRKEDGKIDWQKSAKEIERQIRAFEIWPGSFTFWKKDDHFLRIKILKARILKSNSENTYPVGKTLLTPQNEICLQCGRDFLIIEKLQLGGKREMMAEEFLRGHRDFIGTIIK